MAIIVGASLFGVMGMAALVFDGGNLYRERSSVQNAADNAAMAAAWTSCQGGSVDASVAAGQAEAAANGYSSGVAVVQAGGEWQATVSSEVEGTFSPVMGADSLSTGATAVAECTIGTGGGYAIFAGADNCNNAIDWSGSNTTINGNVHSNNDIHVGGGSNVVNGLGTHLNGVAGSPNITWNPLNANNPSQLPDELDWPLDYTIADFRPAGSEVAAAVDGGRFYNFGSTKIDMGVLDDASDPHGKLWNDSTDTIAAGVYYTRNDIDLSASDITGYVTLVTDPAAGNDGGVISLSGSNHYLRPYHSGGMLIFSNRQFKVPQSNNANCSAPAVKLAGSTQDWGGIVFAPNGMIEMSGSSNTSFDGSLIGWTVKLNGSVQGVTYNDSYGAGDPLLGLLE